MARLPDLPDLFSKIGPSADRVRCVSTFTLEHLDAVSLQVGAPIPLLTPGIYQ